MPGLASGLIGPKLTCPSMPLPRLSPSWLTSCLPGVGRCPAGIAEVLPAASSARPGPAPGVCRAQAPAARMQTAARSSPASSDLPVPATIARYPSRFPQRQPLARRRCPVCPLTAPGGSGFQPTGQGSSQSAERGHVAETDIGSPGTIRCSAANGDADLEPLLIASSTRCPSVISLARAPARRRPRWRAAADHDRV